MGALDSIEPIGVEAEQLLAKSKAKLEVAQSYLIDSDRMYLAAANELGKIKTLQKQVEQTRESMTRPLNESKKRIIEFFKAPESVLKDAERVLKRAILDYEESLIQKEREIQKQALEAIIQRPEGPALAPHIVTPIVHVPKPKAEGTSVRTTYKAVVTNKMELIRAVADGLVPEAAIEINMTFLNNQARALRDALIYPGVQVVADKQISQRAK